MLIAGPLFPAIGIILISFTFLSPSWYVGIVTFAFVVCAIGNGLVATPGLTILCIQHARRESELCDRFI